MTGGVVEPTPLEVDGLVDVELYLRRTENGEHLLLYGQARPTGAPAPRRGRPKATSGLRVWRLVITAGLLNDLLDRLMRDGSSWLGGPDDALQVAEAPIDAFSGDIVVSPGLSRRRRTFWSAGTVHDDHPMPPVLGPHGLHVDEWSAVEAPTLSAAEHEAVKTQTGVDLSRFLDRRGNFIWFSADPRADVGGAHEVKAPRLRTNSFSGTCILHSRF